MVSRQLERPATQSLIDQSDAYRSSLVEVRQLLDKGQSIREKYGDARGWRMSLRYDETRKSDVLEYSEMSGQMH